MSGPKSILVPLDGSDFATQALPLAERLARLTGATLHLVLAHQSTPAWYVPGAGFPALVDLEEEARCRELQYIEQTAARVSETTHLPVTSTILDGETAAAIGQFIKAQKVDLVILTSHGRGGLSRLWIGSVADRLMRTLEIPVLITHPILGTATRDSSLRRILLPLDGSQLAESILDDAKTIARLTDAELVLGMVVEPTPLLLPPAQYPVAIPVEDEETREIAGRLQLHAVAERLRSEGFKCRVHVVRGRNAARQILLMASRESCDLIAMATHGAGGLDRFILGSVTDQVVRGSAVPVLVLRPTGNPVPAGVEPGAACAVGV